MEKFLKKLIMYSLTLIVSAALQAKNGTRLRGAYFSDQSGQLIKIERLNYDSEGNINSVATFDSAFKLIKIDYYFYGPQCATEVHQYIQAKLSKISKLTKSQSCAVLEQDDYLPNKSLISKKRYTYESQALVGFRELNGNNEETAVAKIEYRNSRLDNVKLKIKERNFEIRYTYEESRFPLLLTYFWHKHDKSQPTIRALLRYDTGPISPESEKYLFE